MPRPLHEAIRHAEETADWFEAEGPSPENEIPVAEYFLGLLADVRDLSIDKVRGAVELARRAGASWHEVGEVLGLSASEAERQFDWATTRSMLPQREAEALDLGL